MEETLAPEPVFVPSGTSPGEVAALSQNGRVVRVLASGGQRLTARLLDYLAVVLVWVAPPVLLATVSVVVIPGPTSLIEILIVAAAGIVPFGGWFLLRIARLVWWGCTVGQRIAGIRVVALDGMSNPGWRQAWRRFQPTWGGNSDPRLPTDDYFAWKGAGGRRASSGQCLHDKKASTMVVLAQDAPGERNRRIVLGMVLGVTGLVTAGCLWALERQDADFGSPTRSVASLRGSGAGEVAGGGFGGLQMLGESVSDLADRVIRPIAQQGFADEGVAITTASVIPEATITAEGVHWHPVGVADPDQLVAPAILPLADALAGGKESTPQRCPAAMTSVLTKCERPQPRTGFERQ